MLPYNPVTLRNLPKYAHELPAPTPGKPLPKPVDLSKLLKKYSK
jgi:hypothetical protein